MEPRATEFGEELDQQPHKRRGRVFRRYAHNELGTLPTSRPAESEPPRAPVDVKGLRRKARHRPLNNPKHLHDDELRLQRWQRGKQYLSNSQDWGQPLSGGCAWLQCVGYPIVCLPEL